MKNKEYIEMKHQGNNSEPQRCKEEEEGIGKKLLKF